jgi:glycosyltransferase involved in cell wall biosynthesis
MKVLHIINDLSSGGAEKLISDTLPLMKKKGVEIELMLLDNTNNVFEDNILNNKIKINIIKRKKARSFLNIISIRNFIKNGKFDIVHVHLFPSLYWAGIAARTMFFNKPLFVYTEHNTHNRRRDFKQFKYIDKFIYSSFNKVLSISEATQNSLLNWLKPSIQNINRFRVVSNGIDISRFLRAEPYKKSELLGLSDQDILVCMVGSFSRQKDQETLIRAISNLKEDVHLLLVGEGENKNRCIALASELQISNRVYFLGFRDDVDKIYKTADINILSSKWEGFGLVAVEAIASSKPLIVSKVKGLSDVVSGLGVLKFDVGNEEELAGKIELLIRNINYNKPLDDIEKKLKKFDVNIMVETQINEYVKLLKER